jgi:DNA-binding GntR family transcriptional regulator
LLRVVPQVGTFVAPIRIASVRDSQFVRETLECRVVEEAAGKASEADVAALHDHLATQRQAIANGDHIAFFASDEALHRQIMAITDRPFVWQIIASAKSQLDRVRFISLEDAGWLEQMFSQHEAIVCHIARHEPEAARRVMQAHLRSAFAAIDRIAKEHSDFFEGLDGDERGGAE